MVVRACNPSTQEVEAQGSVRSRLNYMRPCLKNQTEEERVYIKAKMVEVNINILLIGDILYIYTYIYTKLLYIYIYESNYYILIKHIIYKYIVV